LGTLDRYVLREVAQAWLAVTGVLLVVLVSNELAQILGMAAERGYPRAIILDLIGLTSIQNLTVLIPVAMLIGIVLALGRLYHESEMAAIRACGVRPARLLRPIAACATMPACTAVEGAGGSGRRRRSGSRARSLRSCWRWRPWLPPWPRPTSRWSLRRSAPRRPDR